MSWKENPPGIGSATQYGVVVPPRHPTGIKPLPGAHLITGSPYTVEGWGDDVNFYERSEQSYESLQNSLKDYFTKYGLDVNTEDYFYKPIHMLAQPGNLTDQEWDKIQAHKNFNVTATPRNLNPNVEMIRYGSASAPPNADHNLLLTKDGLLVINEANQDPAKGYRADTHEYLHTIDSAAGGDRKMSVIMGDYLNESPPGQGTQPGQAKNVKWTEQTLYEKWMNDPDTEHLNQVSREGFGKFIARALMDETYRNTHSGSYSLSPQEIFARAAANTITPYGYNEGFTKGMFGDLEEGFSNALASFLNN